MGIQVTVSASQIDKERLGYCAISLTNFTDTAEPSIAAGSKVEIGGALYEFTADETGTGFAGIGASNNVYLLLTPAGASVSWSYTTTAPTWDTAKQGFYTGSNRVVAGLYKDAGSNYTSKYIMPANIGTVKKNLIVFTSGAGATWKCPYDGNYKVSVIGGGGGGGGSSASPSSGGGGGGGGTSKKNIFALAGTTFTYTVGGGGAAGAAGAAGGTGSNSTLTDGTSTLTGTGGTGGGGAAGAGAAVAGGAGGIPTGGDENIVGLAGGMGTGAAGTSFSGPGGSSSMGGGAVGRVTAGAGVTSGAYGGGGGGSNSQGATLNQIGGVGSAGVIEIEY